MAVTKKNVEKAVEGVLKSQHPIDDEDAKNLLAMAKEGNLSRELVEAIKSSVKKDKPALQLRSLMLLNRLVEIGDSAIPLELATKKWMDRLIKVAKGKNESVRSAVLQNLVDWHHRFREDQRYIEFGVACQRAKDKGYPLPTPRLNARVGPTVAASGTEVPPAPRGARSSNSPPPAAGPPSSAVPPVQREWQQPQESMVDTVVSQGSKQERMERAERNLAERGVTPKETGYGGRTRTREEPAPRMAPPPKREVEDGEEEEESDDDEDEGKVKAEYEKVKEENLEIDRQIAEWRQKLNDTRLQIKMAEKGEGMGATQSFQEIGNMARTTVRSSRSLLHRAKTEASHIRREMESIKREALAYTQQFQNDLLRLEEMANKHAQAEAKGFDNLKKLYLKEMRERKKLFLQIQEVRGNTRVHVRVRPMIGSERGQEDCTAFPSREDFVIKDAGKPKIFEVDSAFKPSEGTEVGFKEAESLVECAADGYNIAFFAYGPSKSGRSHTIIGSGKEPGYAQLSCDKFFACFRERSESEECKLTVGCFDLIDTTVNDLIDTSRRSLEVKQSDAAGCYIDGLTQQDCSSAAAAKSLIQKASEGRTKDPKAAFVVLFQVVCENLQSGSTSMGKLYCVDLPASERGERMCQGLASCMEKLQQNAKADQIPFKSTKLTYLLQDTLGGSSKQLFLLTASPAKSSMEQTIDSLKYGFRVRGAILGK